MATKHVVHLISPHAILAHQDLSDIPSDQDIKNQGGEAAKREQDPYGTYLHCEQVTDLCMIYA